MVTDPLADMLNRIKNGNNAGAPLVSLPYSKMKHAVADVLAREGYIANVAQKGSGVSHTLEITLAYKGDKPRVSGVKRVSKPSRRLYARVREIRPVRHGFGTMVLSTPKGILTDKEARTEHVGGEILFTIF